MSSEENYFYNCANEKFDEEDYQGAIEDSSKAIELNPEKTFVFKKMKEFSLNIGDNKKARELTIKLLILRIKQYFKEITWGVIFLFVPLFWRIILKNRKQSYQR